MAGPSLTLIENNKPRFRILNLLLLIITILCTLLVFVPWFLRISFLTLQSGAAIVGLVIGTSGVTTQGPKATKIISLFCSFLLAVYIYILVNDYTALALYSRSMIR